MLRKECSARKTNQSSSGFLGWEVGFGLDTQSRTSWQEPRMPCRGMRILNPREGGASEHI